PEPRAGRSWPLRSASRWPPAGKARRGSAGSDWRARSRPRTAPWRARAFPTTGAAARGWARQGPPSAPAVIRIRWEKPTGSSGSRQLEHDEQTAEILALAQFHFAAVDLDHVTHDGQAEAGARLFGIEPRAAREQ